MNREDITKKILDKIEGENIQPKPRWQFLLKDYVLWVLAILSVIVGALGLSATIFSLSHAGWDLYRATHENVLTFAVSVFPYIWVLVFIIFIGASYYNFKHTKSGYKFKFSTLILGTILATLVLGIMFSLLGTGRIVERQARHLPFQKPTEQQILERWSQPENGLIAGEIKVIDHDSFTMEDLNAGEWSVSYDELGPRQVNFIREGFSVRIIGEQINDREFYACFIVPLKLQPEMRQQIRPQRGGERRPPNPEMMVRKIIERKSDGERSSKCESVRSYINNR